MAALPKQGSKPCRVAQSQRSGTAVMSGASLPRHYVGCRIALYRMDALRQSMLAPYGVPLVTVQIWYSTTSRCVVLTAALGRRCSKVNSETHRATDREPLTNVAHLPNDSSDASCEYTPIFHASTGLELIRRPVTAWTIAKGHGHTSGLDPCRARPVVMLKSSLAGQDRVTTSY